MISDTQAPPSIPEARHFEKTQSQASESDPQRVNFCIHRLFELQAEKTPDAIALTCEGQRLTYRDLNARANQLAHHLQSLGTGPEVVVAICARPSIDLVIGILGILKAGGAYLPLDSSEPVERLRFMLEQSKAAVLLTQKELASDLAQYGLRAVLIDGAPSEFAGASVENPASETTPDSLCYLMPTSGSTGKPKGVMVVHRGVARLVKGANYADFSSDQVFLLLAPVTFDASTFEIWGALLNGARLAIMARSKPSLEEIGRAIKEHEVTTLWLTAGLFHLMVDERLEDLRPLRQLLAGGDVLSPAHARKVLENLPGCHLINGYGPTENTTFTCCHSITLNDCAERSIPIGKPISNTTVYLLDSDLRPVPAGEVGEIHIGGDGLGRGYLNSQALTAQRFIQNPLSGERAERLYKTGDLARYRTDRTLEFVGRADNQVKIRGYRIELGEIEETLGQHASVREKAVLARQEADGKRLVAYLVLNRAATASEFRMFLRSKLPSYMIPAEFVFLQAMPLTASGKIDRNELPRAHGIRARQRAAYIAPATRMELALAKVWREVMGADEIGASDNFFDLGADSLQIARAHSKICSLLNADIELVALYQCPTISSIARYLSSGLEQSTSARDVQDQAQRRKAAMARQRQIARGRGNE